MQIYSERRAFMKKLPAILFAAAAAMVMCSCGDADISSVTMEGEKIKSASKGVKITAVTDNITKTTGNPLISNIFCADPTAVEYEGRLYVYGTNDQQQYEAVGAEGSNTYEHIKSLVMLSTDDMVNWTYHGTIDVGEISPWAIASWAPSVVSRVEEDGKTHFYLYYSNSGWGVGVLTADSPTGPWTDPLGKSIIDGNTKGLDGCKTPFDPGVVIDDEGTGWLSFGGGEDSARIVRLGSDMISLDSDIKKIPSSYHFEASELNFINGTYVYTYNNDWSTHLKWGYPKTERAPACSMAYLTTKTPLDPDSWEYRDYYFKNPGEAGMEYSNNHTHLQKYKDRYYLFYHSLFPQKALGTEGGFRSLCVNEAVVDEETVTIGRVNADKNGAEQIKPLDPFAVNQAETAFSSADVSYNNTDVAGNMTVSSSADGGKAAVVWVKGADFGSGASSFAVKAKGKGRIEVYLDGKDTLVGAAEFDCKDMKIVCAKLKKKISGEHDIYFVISQNAEFDEWQFVK